MEDAVDDPIPVAPEVGAAPPGISTTDISKYIFEYLPQSLSRLFLVMKLPSSHFDKSVLNFFSGDEKSRAEKQKKSLKGVKRNDEIRVMRFEYDSKLEQEENRNFTIRK